MSDNIRTIIVDGQPLFREGVANMLSAQPDFEVVGRGATAEDAISLTCDLLPDLLLLDVNQRGTGLSVVQTIAASCPVVKLVILTASEEAEDVVAALKAGARAYILKDVAPAELVAVLRSVYAGDVYITPSLAASLLREVTGALAGVRQPVSPLDRLTDRERQILEGVVAGRSNREIGAQLALSEKTIKYYMTNILQKLQVRNRVEAALLAQRYGSAEEQ